MADLKSEKEVWLNKLRQTKEYQGSSEGRKYLDNLDPVQQVLAQQIEEYDEWANKANNSEEMKEITLKEQMEEIADIVVPTINDTIFNEIIEVMDDYDELNWGYFVQDDAPTSLLDACFEHKTELHYEIFQLVLQKLK